MVCCATRFINDGADLQQMRTFAVVATLAIIMAATAMASNANEVLRSESQLPIGECSPEYVPHIGMACQKWDGLYYSTLSDGFTMATHGPDPVPPPGDVGFELGAEQRPPVCVAEWKMHVLYGHPEGLDRSAEVVPQIREAVYRMNALLNADAIESGDVEADYRVLCDSTGQVRIDTFEGPTTGGSGAYTIDFNAVVEAARHHGFSSEDTDYLIFYDGTSDGVCGVGNLARDDSLSEHNENMEGPDYGVAYENCWFGRTPMHENGHTQGAVQDLAPDNELSGHCLEGRDVMCYPTSSILVFCSDRIHFDCDHDTYFDAEPEDGEWLATHWNLGSRLNRYLHFSDQVFDPGTPDTSGDAETDTSDDEEADEGDDPTTNSTQSQGNNTATEGQKNETAQPDSAPESIPSVNDDVGRSESSESLFAPGPSVVMGAAALLAMTAWIHRQRRGLP